MALEHKIDGESFENLNESVREHYAKDGESYFLQANGMAPKSKIDEFRQENISVRQQNETLSSSVADLESKLKVASSGTSDEKLKQLIDEGVANNTKAMKEDHDKLLSDALSGKTKAEQTLNGLLVNDAVNREAIGAGVKDTAVSDILTRAGNVFRVVNGQAVAFDGDSQIYGKDGTTPLSMKDWLAGQAATAPHLFKESTGSGAENNSGGGAAKKTMSRTDFEGKNPAEQMAFVKSGGTITTS